MEDQSPTTWPDAIEERGPGGMPEEMRATFEAARPFILDMVRELFPPLPSFDGTMELRRPAMEYCLCMLFTVKDRGDIQKILNDGWFIESITPMNTYILFVLVRPKPAPVDKPSGGMSIPIA